ncbi:MAG: Tetratricopeptide repeat [Planctomycetota bacterium]|jgi:Flp pilus assembly protein TadD
MSPEHPNLPVRRGWRAPLCALLLVLASCQATTNEEADWFDGGPMRPASAETLQLTARVLASKGETARAGAVLDRLLREHPDHLGTYTEGAEVLLHEGRVSDAVGWLDRGLARFPGHAVLLNDRGLCHLLVPDLVAATKDFEAAYATDPNDADYVGNLALVRALAGREDDARALWSRVVDSGLVEGNLDVARKARERFAQAAK